MQVTPGQLYELNEYLVTDDSVSAVTRESYVTLDGNDIYILEWIKQYAIKQVLAMLGLVGLSKSCMRVDIDEENNTITISAIDPVNQIHGFYFVDFVRIW